MVQGLGAVHSVAMKVRRPIQPIAGIGLVCLLGVTLLSACDDKPQQTATLRPTDTPTPVRMVAAPSRVSPIPTATPTTAPTVTSSPTPVPQTPTSTATPTLAPAPISIPTPTPSSHIPTPVREPTAPSRVSPIPTATPTTAPTVAPSPTPVPQTPTSTATPTPDPTDKPPPTPTPSPTPTSAPTPGTLNIDESTLGRDLFGMFTDAETKCIREELSDDKYEEMLGAQVLGGSKKFYLTPMSCLAQHKAVELSIALVAGTVGGLSAESRSCLNNVYTDYNGTGFGFILVTWFRPEEVIEGLSFYSRFKACLKDEEAAGLAMYFDNYVRPSPSELRCLFERTTVERFAEYVDKRSIALWNVPPPGYNELRDTLLSSFDECGITSFAYDEPPPVQRGRLLWRFRASSVVRSSPVVWDGTVFFGAADERLYAVDAGTGELRWRIPMEGDDALLAAADGVVYVSADSYLHAVDPDTGDIRWSYYTGPVYYSYPTVSEGVVYIGGWNGRMYAIDGATGELRWEYEEEASAFRSSPVVDRGSVYISSTSGTLYAFDAATGAVIWQSRIENRGNYKSPAVGDGAVYLSDDEHLYAFDAATGDRLWKVEARVSHESRMTVANGVLYFYSGGALNAVDTASGAYLWSRSAGESMNAPTVSEGIVYIGSHFSPGSPPPFRSHGFLGSQGFFVAADGLTGDLLWRYPTDGIVLFPPAVVDGVAYSGSSDDYLYALTTDADAPDWFPTPTPTRTPVTGLAKLTTPSVGTRVGWGLSGVAVAASADGLTIVVGDFGVSTDRQDYGVAYVFTNQEDVWTDVGPKEVTVLLPTDRDDWEEPEGKDFIDLSGAFGQTVGVSGDGSVIAVGYTSGAVNVFLRPDTGWEDGPDTVTLRASDDATFDGPHTSLAVSEDGEHIILAYVGRHDTYGTVYVFTRPETGWADATETARLTTPFGTLHYTEQTSVAISKDGATIILGAAGDDGTGSCFVFLRPGPEWMDTIESARLLPSDGDHGDYFGSSVAVSADGAIAVAGAPGKDAYAEDHGAAYVFIRPDAGWDDAIESAKLTASDGMRGDGFGTSMIITDGGKRIVVGAPRLLLNFSVGGTVYMFAKPPTGWTDASAAPELTNADLTDEEALLHRSLERSMARGGSFIVLGSFAGDAYVLNDALVTSSTGGADTGVPQRATPIPVPVIPSPELLWSFRTDDSVWLSPAVADGVVYVGADDLYALDASAGHLLWRYESGYHSGKIVVGSSPVVVDGVVYVGDLRGTVAELDASTGELLRRYGIFDSVRSTPAVVDGVIYVGSEGRHVYAFEPSNGEPRWLQVINPELIWRYETGDEVYSSPAVADGTVYVGSNDGKIHALLASTGELVWSYETGDAVRSSPAVADGVVYAGSDDRHVYALDASTGELVWSYETGDAVYSSPAVIDGVVYVGSNDRRVYALNASTGELVWQYETVGSVYSSPAVVDGVVYVGSNDRRVYALDASTGELVWRYRTGSDVISSPAVVNGVVYIGSVDGHVYALQSSTAE